MAQIGFADGIAHDPLQHRDDLPARQQPAVVGQLQDGDHGFLIAVQDQRRDLVDIGDFLFQAGVAVAANVIDEDQDFLGELALLPRHVGVGRIKDRRHLLQGIFPLLLGQDFAVEDAFLAGDDIFRWHGADRQPRRAVQAQEDIVEADNQSAAEREDDRHAQHEQQANAELGAIRRDAKAFFQQAGEARVHPANPAALSRWR